MWYPNVFLDVSDVDECRTVPLPCRGDMLCVNQNGGYLCIPRDLYNQPYARPDTPALPEPAYPDTSAGFPPDTFRPPPPGPVEPSYPIVSRSAPCILGYTLGEDGTCNGECAVNLVLSQESKDCINLMAQTLFHTTLLTVALGEKNSRSIVAYPLKSKTILKENHKAGGLDV